MDHEGLRETVGRFLGFFYADYGVVGSRDLEWLKHAMNVLVGIFIRYGLANNVAKSRTMTCQPGALQSGMSEETMALKFAGVVDSYRVGI